MNILFPTIEFMNDTYYDGTLLELSTLDSILQDYKEGKDDLGLTWADFRKGIPTVWNHKELIEDLYGKNNIYTPVMKETPNWYVYMYIYPDMLLQEYVLGDKKFFHAPMYVGKGTLARVCGHAQPKGPDTTIPSTMLRDYLIDLRKSKLEPQLFILAKELDETRAKWLEADVINYFMSARHYTKGVESFRVCSPILNMRREKENEGHLIKSDGTFGKK